MASVPLSYVAVCCGLAVTLLSLVASWRPSIWYDEAATLSAVHRPWWSLWQLVQHVDAVHLLYYSLLRSWCTVFGSGAFSIRAMSALLLGGCCALAVSVAGSILGDATARWTAVVLLVLPGLTWCGLDARPTALSCFTTLLATWLLLRADRSSRRLWWPLYGAVIVLTVVAQVLTALILPIHLLLVRRRRAWLLTVLAALPPVAAMVVIAHFQQAQLAWLHVIVSEAVPSLLFSQNVLGLRSDSGWLVTVLAPAVLSAVAWAAALYGLRRRAELKVLAWAVVPGALAIVWSLTFGAVYQERYFTWCVPAFAMLVGSGLERLRRRNPRMAIGTVLIVAVLACPIVVAQRHTNAKYLQDYRSLARRVATLPRAGTGVVYANPESRAAAATYPRAFRGLRDLSRRLGPIATATFWGADVPASTSVSAVARLGLRHVLLLYEWTTPYARLAAPSELARIGCRPRWTLSLRRTHGTWFSCVKGSRDN